jgi:S1-C subfamily serine protease
LRAAFFGLLVAVALLPAAGRAQEEDAPPEVLAPQEVTAKLSPSVVQIVVGEVTGTGVKVPGGVLTSARVVEAAPEIELITNEGTVEIATVLRVDPSRDLALVDTGLPLPDAELESSAAQRQGDEVYVLGYPLGLGGQPTLTRGLISGVRLNDHGLDLLLTDAATTPGAPVINAQGRVLGIGSYYAQGLSFAIASESIDTFLAQPPPLTDSPLPWLVEARTRPTPTPLPTPTPAATPLPTPRPFSGTPEDASLKPEDFGPGWAINRRSADSFARRGGSRVQARNWAAVPIVHRRLSHP